MDSNIAQELWYLVFSFLDFRSLAAAQSVCSMFHQLGATNQFWRNLVHTHFVDGSIYFKPATPVDEGHKALFKRLLGINLNGNWLSYTAREGQEQEQFLREKSVYISTNIEKVRGGYTPTSLADILNETNTNATTTTTTSTSTTTASTTENNNNNNNNINTTINNKYSISSLSSSGGTPPNYYRTGSAPDDASGEQTSKRRKSNTPTSVVIHKNADSAFPHAYLGVGKAPWADIVVMGCQWGQFNCCVQLYFHSNYRTESAVAVAGTSVGMEECNVLLYESSPSGRVMIGGFFSNWYNLIGMSSMCLPDTPRDTVLQVMNHAWAVHNSTHKWEGMLGDWAITFTYQDGRQQVYTFSIKNQRKMGLSGSIKGIYSKPTEIPTMMEVPSNMNMNMSMYNYADPADDQRAGGDEANSPPFYNAPNNFDVSSFPTGGTMTPAGLDYLAVSTPFPAAVSLHPEPESTLAPEPEPEQEDEDLMNEDEDDDDQSDPNSQVPSFLGVVTGHCVGLSFYTLGGTAFGKFITCMGQIEPEANTKEHVLRVPPDEYVIRELTLRGHFMEKLLDPHADQNTMPRAEEGTWRAVRRTRFMMDM